MNKNLMREIPENIIDAADELLEKQEKDQLEQGELIAYAESLSIIREACTGYELSEIGLDFDIDGKYLT